jgi:hypothetical protein
VVLLWQERAALCHRVMSSLAWGLVDQIVEYVARPLAPMAWTGLCRRTLSRLGLRAVSIANALGRVVLTAHDAANPPTVGECGLPAFRHTGDGGDPGAR